MRRWWKSGVFVVATVALSVPAQADTVCEWIAYSDGVIDAATPPAQPGAPQSPEHGRALTQVALAMFEALNAVDPRYESYLKVAKSDRPASSDAAAAAAAYHVLLAHFPGQKAGLDDNLAIVLDAVADPAAREAGRAIGERAAKAALAVGGIDPAIVQTPYRPRTTPGVWTATALPVIAPFVSAFTPWVLPRADAVRPAPPPALDSARWAKDFDEVKHVGGRDSKVRSAHETLMARYRITPDMMPTFRLIADAPGRTPVQNARLFALLQMAADDAMMANGEAKLHYNFWRPITAIRNAADDGNPATAPDPGWAPLISTPNHPEYPCGHCTYAAVTATVLKAEVGTTPPGGVRVASISIPGAAIQALPDLDEWVREVSYSRILGGVHYRFSNEAGEAIGLAVGTMAVSRLLRPLPETAKRQAALSIPSSLSLR